MDLWLFSWLLTTAYLLRAAVAVSEKQVVYRSNWGVNSWSKSLLSTRKSSSRVDCVTQCTLVECVHYHYDREAKTCSLFSDGNAIGIAGNTSGFSKERCSSNSKTWTSLFDGEWQIFARRLDGSVDFSRPWADYRAGFGDPCGEFWLGLEALHTLTSSRPYKLRVEMTAWNATQYFSEYSSFSVGPESASYMLNVSGYQNNSTAGDSLTKYLKWPGVSNYMKFSTYDKDNDLSNGSCAVIYGGAGWFNSCHYANPLGKHYPSQRYNDGHGIVWFTTFNNSYTFKHMVLKISPFDYRINFETNMEVD